jgi:hypothetical protein
MQRREKQNYAKQNRKIRRSTTAKGRICKTDKTGIYVEKIIRTAFWVSESRGSGQDQKEENHWRSYH